MLPAMLSVRVLAENADRFDRNNHSWYRIRNYYQKLIKEYIHITPFAAPFDYANRF